MRIQVRALVAGEGGPPRNSRRVIASKNFRFFLHFEACDPSMFHLSSCTAMLITMNIRSSLAETASAVSGLPCWHSFDEKRQSGYVQALAGRDAS